MDDERKELLLNTALRSFASTFTIVIFVFLLVGFVVARYAPHAYYTSTIFALRGVGLSYNTILQIAGYSVIISIFNVLLFSEYFFVRMRFLQRMFFLLLATLLATSIFSIIFNWLPVDDVTAWVVCLLATITFFVIFSSLALLKFKLEGKKYNKLLEKYKDRKMRKYCNSPYTEL